MKKQILTLAAACTLLFATACGSDSNRNEQSSTHTEMMQGEHAEEGMAHDDMMHEGMDHEGMMQDGEMKHQPMSNMAADGEAYEGPTFDQIPQNIQSHVQLLTRHYLSIKNALVATNASEAQAAAGELLTALNAFDAGSMPKEMQQPYQQQISGVKEAATAISKSSDVEAQRKQFGPLSQGMYSLNKAFASNDQSLYRQHCPMANNNKGGYWLSADKEVRNPYFGDKMLKCGKVTETM